MELAEQGQVCTDPEPGVKDGQGRTLIGEGPGWGWCC